MEAETDEEVLIKEEETILIASDSAGDFPPSEEGTSPHTQTRRPADKYHLIYFLFVLVAVGLLTPWNSFILAIDYFRFLYPTRHVENVIPYTELTLTLLGSLAMLALVNVIPRHVRIWFGYVVFILVLLFVPLMDIGIHNCTVSTDVGFGLTVVSVALLALGGGSELMTTPTIVMYGLIVTGPPLPTICFDWSIPRPMGIEERQGLGTCTL